VTQKGSGGKQAQVGSPVLLAYLRGSIQYNGVPERTLLAFTANLEMFVVIVRAEFPPWLPVYSESEWGAFFLDVGGTIIPTPLTPSYELIQNQNGAAYMSF
jgi:hypothetical protein